MTKLTTRPQCVKSQLSSHRLWCQVPQWVAARLTGPVLKTYIHLRNLRRIHRRICHRHLAALCGVSQETIRRHVRAMERAQVLRTVHTCIGPRRNAPNLYILLDVDGRDLISPYPHKRVVEKQPRVVANTPPSRRHDNHPPAMRKIFEAYARVSAENRGLREIVRSCSRKDDYMSSNPLAITGTLDEETQEMLRARCG